MSGLTIRPVAGDDLPAVRHLAFLALGTPVPGPFLAALARERPDRFRVAHDRRGRVCGFAVAARQPGANAHVFLLAVDPNDHGRGIRRALLEDMEGVLRGDAEEGMAVDVSKGDFATIELLRSQGFKVIGVERDSIGAERFVFVKRLAAHRGREVRVAAAAARPVAGG